MPTPLKSTLQPPHSGNIRVVSNCEYCLAPDDVATLLELARMFLSRISDKIELNWTASLVAICAGHKHRGEAMESALKFEMLNIFQGSN